MIEKRSIRILTYVLTWLAPHKRQPNRLKLFRVLLQPFITLMDDFVIWRNTLINDAYVTNELMSIEAHLNDLFDATDRSIYIRNNEDTPLTLGDETAEPTLFATLGDETIEPTLYTTMVAMGEDPELNMYDFGVFIPASLASSTDDIRAVVKKYAYGYKTFTIITF